MTIIIWRNYWQCCRGPCSSWLYCLPPLLNGLGTAKANTVADAIDASSLRQYADPGPLFITFQMNPMSLNAAVTQPAREDAEYDVGYEHCLLGAHTLCFAFRLDL